MEKRCKGVFTMKPQKVLGQVLAVLAVALAAWSSPPQASAWGPVTHAYYFGKGGSDLLIGKHLPQPYRQAMVRAPLAFVYGAVFPDIHLMRKAASFYNKFYAGCPWNPMPSHEYYLALDLLNKARTEEEISFALGMISHQVGDQISQNIYVPRRINEDPGPFAEKWGEPVVDGMTQLQHLAAIPQMIRAHTMDTKRIDDFFFRVIQGPPWNSPISRARFDENISCWKKLILATGVSTKILDVASGALQVVPEQIRKRMLGLLDKNHYRSIHEYDELHAHVMRDLVLNGPGSVWASAWPWGNPFAYKASQQQWYNDWGDFPLNPRDKNKDGLLIYDATFVYQDAADGRWYRIKKASPGVCRQAKDGKIYGLVILNAWKPYDHEVRVEVRRDVAHWADALVTAVNQRIRFTWEDIKNGVRRTIRVPFSFRENQWRFQRGLLPYTRGFYLEAFLNKENHADGREEFSTKADPAQIDENTYGEWPYSLLIDPAHSGKPETHGANPDSGIFRAPPGWTYCPLGQCMSRAQVK
jgi:hypothetical protein